MRLGSFLVWALLTCGTSISAQTLDQVLDNHILPSASALSAATAELAAIPESTCISNRDAVRTAYMATFDAWLGYGHLRFGPTEVEERGFAMAFWPDSRGATPRSLQQLFSHRAFAQMTADDFAAVSVAARGLYSLEFLLYDAPTVAGQSPEDVCRLIDLIAEDMAANAAAIAAEWREGYGDLFRGAGGNDIFQSEDEALRAAYTALTTGLQFTSEMRLGRPLGTFERPRPTRAEAWRSGRSLRNVVLSLEALEDLAYQLSDGDAGIEAAFQAALRVAEELDDPVFAGVEDPTGRLRVEILKQRIDSIREIVSNELGPKLGIAAGFNALDGD